MPVLSSMAAASLSLVVHTLLNHSVQILNDAIGVSKIKFAGRCVFRISDKINAKPSFTNVIGIRT